MGASCMFRADYVVQLAPRESLCLLRAPRQQLDHRTLEVGQQRVYDDDLVGADRNCSVDRLMSLGPFETARTVEVEVAGAAGVVAVDPCLSDDPPAPALASVWFHHFVSFRGHEPTKRIRRVDGHANGRGRSGLGRLTSP